MDEVARRVDAHYQAFGQRDPILKALGKRGVALETLTPEALASFDQFHTGRADATVALADLLAPAKEAHILDVGSGLGGPARMLAALKGCRVTGVDITAHFIENARFFTELTKQEGSVSFRHASALELPFVDQSFDGAWHLHVAMNISEKARMYAEIFRVLKTGGRLAIHDPTGDHARMRFPVPWAETADASYLISREALRGVIEGAGFRFINAKDTTAEGIAHYAALDAGAHNASRPPTPLEVMQSNHRANLADGAVQVVAMLFVKPGN